MGTISLNRQSDGSGVSIAHRRRLVSRACDRCKARKIKCSGAQPCHQCRDSAFSCTYLITQQVRGPRVATRLNPRSRNDNTEPRGSHGPHGPEVAPLRSITRPEASGRSCLPVTTNTMDQTHHHIPTCDLIAQLQLFNSKLASIWPIVNVDDMVTNLESSNDIECRALATAVVAATMSQLSLSIYCADRRNIADQAVAECHEYCLQLPIWKSPNLTTLRIRFFLHAYYENIRPGSSESLLYLREAVTLVQILGLHEEIYHVWLPEEDAHLSRALFWLLFVTERLVYFLPTAAYLLTFLVVSVSCISYLQYFVPL